MKFFVDSFIMWPSWGSDVLGCANGAVEKVRVLLERHC